MNKKLLVRIISTLLILAFSLSTSAGGGGVRWKTIRVDGDRTFSVTNSSLKLYGYGIPSIAYGADHLYYATLVGGVFETTVVDNNWGVGRYASLVIEPSTGHPRISYYDGTNERLKYAAMDAIGLSHTWTITPVDGNISDPSGNKTAIALENGTGLPHIAYIKQDGHVWHAWKTCSLCTWQKEEVDNTVTVGGSNISLAIDTNNHLHLAYYDNVTTALYYAFYNGTTWATEQVPDPYGYSLSGEEPSLVLDGDNRPAIVYNTYSSINYAWKTNDSTPGDWSFSIIYVGHTISDRLTAPSLQLPNDDATQPRISFIDSNYHVEIAVFDDMGTYDVCNGTDGDYGCSIIDNTSIFRGSTSLAVEESVLGNLNRLVYIDGETGELRYKFESSEGVWGSQAVDYSTNVGASSSLVVDANGPEIAYYDRDATVFKFAAMNKSTPGGCGDYGMNTWFQCQGFDHAVVGSSISLANGGNDGFSHVAYRDRDHPGALQYGSLNPGWSSVVIDDSSADIGWYPSIALNPASSRMAIAYIDYTNGRLKYAKERSIGGGNCGPGGFWDCEYIDTIGQDDYSISLTFGYDNVPLISYLDGDAQLVKVARYIGTGAGYSTCANTANWDCSAIAPGNLTDRGQTSIWADSTTGYIWVSWHDSDATTLMVSTYSPLLGGWGTETADQASYSGDQSSITVVGTMPVVAYTDGRFNRNSLMLASRVGGMNGNCGQQANWYCEQLDTGGLTGYSPSIQNYSGRLYISYYDWTNGDLKLIFQAFPALLPIIKKP